MIYTGYFHWLWFYFLCYSSHTDAGFLFIFILLKYHLIGIIHPDNSINKNAHLNMKKKKNGNKKRFHFIIFTLLLRFLLMSVAINHLTWLLISFRSLWKTEQQIWRSVFFFQFYICSRLKKRFSLYLACSMCKEETVNIELKNPNRAETKNKDFEYVTCN